jgi:hypothetical protein
MRGVCYAASRQSGRSFFGEFTTELAADSAVRLTEVAPTERVTSSTGDKLIPIQFANIRTARPVNLDADRVHDNLANG